MQSSATGRRQRKERFVAPIMKRLIAGALLSTGLVAGAGLATGTAQADNPDWGPAHHWCPGEPLPPTGNHVTDPFRGWDMSVCHTYYYLWPGMGNVSNMIWDGDNPPPKPPPPPALITRDNCQQILGIFCPKA
ncbi:hypothetical protein A5653_05725 [Mycobacterium colombiense]|nr:hypothetical protein A5653_05725 [Mycobacterium colombiense]